LLISPATVSQPKSNDQQLQSLDRLETPTNLTPASRTKKKKDYADQAGIPFSSAALALWNLTPLSTQNRDYLA